MTIGKDSRHQRVRRRHDPGSSIRSPGHPPGRAVTGPAGGHDPGAGDFDGPLVDYKGQGYTIDLVGRETLGERKVHHLRMTSPSRQVGHLYLDAHLSRGEAGRPRSDR